ncbi:MAG: hypothetical protein QOK48_2374 [Blastocatellia bacterium]|jgi:hypothetical protein|nr:hypothetical protein [Blastocatellia bacterium]
MTRCFSSGDRIWVAGLKAVLVLPSCGHGATLILQSSRRCPTKVQRYFIPSPSSFVKRQDISNYDIYPFVCLQFVPYGLPCYVEN